MSDKQDITEKEEVVAEQSKATEEAKVEKPEEPSKNKKPEEPSKDIKEKNKKDKKPKDKKTTPVEGKKKIAVIVVAIVICVALAGAIVTAIIVGTKAGKKETDDTDTSETISSTQETTMVPVDVAVTDDKGELVTDDKGEMVTETTMIPSVVTSEVDTANIDPDDPDLETTYLDPTPETEETSIVVADGEKTWPSVLPSEIPQCKNTTFCNNCGYSNTSFEEVWDLSWNTTKEAYEAWDAEVRSTFKMSQEVYGYMANGTLLLDISTEENDDGTIWVSMYVTKSKPIKYPVQVATVPRITTTATQYSWSLDAHSKKMCIYYACSESWSYDIEVYKEALASAGFTVGDDYATKDNIKVSFYGEENGVFMDEMIVITY